MTLQLEKLFSAPDTESSTVFLTRDELASQDAVYRLMNDVFCQQMVPWASEVFQRTCLPVAETTRVANATTFAVVLAAMTKTIQENTEKFANSWLNAATTMRKQKKFSQTQFGLALRARNIASMFLSHYLLMQWQRSAVFSIFIRIVQDEVFQDYDRTESNQMYNSFYIFQDGFDRNYNRAAQEVSIGQQVESKIAHACFGRHMIWATKIYVEMKTHLEKANIDARVLYTPIYLQLQNSNECLSSVLEFFMRLMYISVFENISTVLKREAKNGHTSATSPIEYIQKYFNVSLALAKNLLAVGPIKRAKISEDDDNDDHLVQFSAKNNHKLCGDTEYLESCLPHQRNLAANLEVAEFKSLFTLLQEKKYALFGEESISRESSLCLWVVWLQNVDKIYAIAIDNECEAKDNLPSTLGTSSDRIGAALNLLTCTPKPHIFTCIMDCLRQFIERHYSILLRETGFDLNQNGLINALYRQIGVLCDFYSVANVSILESHFITKKN